MDKLCATGQKGAALDAANIEDGKWEKLYEQYSALAQKSQQVPSERAERLRVRRRKLNRFLDWAFRWMAVVHGLCFFCVIGMLEQDDAYPPVTGFAWALVFLVVMVACLWMGNVFTEWLGRRPSWDKEQEE